MEALVRNRMPKSLRVRVPKAILRRLAELARVPAERRSFYFESVLTDLGTARELDALAKGALATKKGATLQRTSGALIEMLSKLNQDEREFLEAILAGRSSLLFSRISIGGMDGLLQAAFQMALLLSLATGRSPPDSPYQSAKPRQRGRKSGSMKHWMFQDFVFNLLISTTTADGNLTLDKDIPRHGTLLEAIDVLAPYLPDGFVPRALSSSTLQRLKNRLHHIRTELADQK